MILADLEGRIEGFRSVPWYSMGKTMQSEFVQATDRPDALVLARAIALEGQRAYPASVGGQRCAHIVASIEAPDFSLQGMSLDGPGRRSFAVSHKNLKAVYFRAYPVDLVQRITTSRDYNLLPQWREVEAVIQGQKPVASWRADLPPRPTTAATAPSPTRPSCRPAPTSSPSPRGRTSRSRRTASWPCTSP